jgi:HK97 family phage major capsid protein
VEPLERLRTQRAALDAEMTRLMGIPAAENRDATVEEVRAISALDDRLVALDDLIGRAERRQAAQVAARVRVKVEAETREENPPSRGVRSAPPGEAPSIGTPRSDQRPYSVARAIRCIVRAGGSIEGLDGLEAEIHQETVRRSGGRVFEGFAIPTSMDPEIRALMFPSHAEAILERRDVTTSTVAGGIYTVPRGFVDILRARQVVRKMGFQIYDDLRGNFGLTRQTGANSFQFVGEEVSASPTNITEDQIPFTPHLAIGTSVISRQAIMQNSYSVEEKTDNDLAQVMARGVDYTVFMGPGGASPTGLFNNTIIQTNSASLVRGTNGGVIDYPSLVRMRGVVATANADMGKMGYVSNSAVETSLRLTVKQAPGNTANVIQAFAWEDGPEPGVGRVNGLPAWSTNLIPNTLVKGTASNCSAIGFGNWEDAAIAFWDTGIDTIVDPYTGKRAGSVEITMYMAMDFHPLHEASFSIITDVTPS